MATEQPQYEQLVHQGSFEIREYNAVIVAETVVKGDLDAASRDGFRLIANYIFGNNHKNQDHDPEASEKIAMTSPVIAEPQADFGNIPITLSPSAEKLGSTHSIETANCWRIQFFMPRQYTLATLPRPNNDAVILRALPSSRYAVVSFSGLTTQSKIQKKTEELMLWMRSKDLIALEAPKLARYDPPWTLPWARRNEIQIQVEYLESE